MRTLGLALSLALAGCGNWDDADAVFLAALPLREELKLTPPEASATAQGLESGLGRREDGLGTSEVYGQVVGTAKRVNGFVDAVTSGLDLVRRLRPTERTETTRTWGPHADEERPGLEVRVVMERAADASYDYRFQWRRKGEGDFVTVIGGHFEGAQARQGSGGLHLDGAAARSLGMGDTETESIRLDYDMGGGAAQATLRHRSTQGRDYVVAYQVQPEGGGWMQFRWDGDAVGGGALEQFEVVSRWLAERSGRASAVVTGGDLGSRSFGYDECWDARARQVYRSQEFDCGAPGKPACTEGSPSLCSVGALR